MNDPSNAFRQSLADSLGKDLDPLAKYETSLNEAQEKSGNDALDQFWEHRIDESGKARRTKNAYETLFKQWRVHMDIQGRNVACPNKHHVEAFMDYLQNERDNSSETVRNKLQLLNAVYKFWQNNAVMPHNQDFNPFREVLDSSYLPSNEKKKPYPISIAELRDIVADVKYARNLAIILVLLKLGLRATALTNIELQDITLPNPDFQNCYPELGSNSYLEGKDSAIYIPHDRDGNKSKSPRVMPLDDELRRTISEWLLIRWDNGEPYLFLSDGHEQMGRNGVNNIVKDVFPDEYLEDSDQYAKVRSHYGRKRFTTYWKIEEDIPIEWVNYMRGSPPSKGNDFSSGDAINDYLHTYYDDIRDVYRERIFKLGV